MKDAPFQCYFYNAFTGETQWEPPHPPETMPNGWSIHWCMESGKPYFEDVAGKVTYWEPWWKLSLAEPPPPRRDSSTQSHKAVVGNDSCRQAFENIALTPVSPYHATMPTDKFVQLGMAPLLPSARAGGPAYRVRDLRQIPKMNTTMERTPNGDLEKKF